MTDIKVGDIVEVVKPLFQQNKGLRYRVTEIDDPSYGTTQVHGIITERSKYSGCNFAVGEEAHWPVKDIRRVEPTPVIIPFSSIQEGDKIRVAWTGYDAEYTVVGVADRKTTTGGRWATRSGTTLARSDGRDKQVIELLERKPKPTTKDFGVGTVVKYRVGQTATLVATKIAENKWSIYSVDSPTWILNDLNLQDYLNAVNANPEFLNTELTRS